MRTAFLAFLFAAAIHAQTKPGLLICVSSDAPDEVRAAAAAVRNAVPHHALLSLFANGDVPPTLCVSEDLATGAVEPRAYHHLVLVGLPNDPLIAAAWQREARPEPQGLYIFGFGHLTGDIGYLESDRNPFLHGAAIPKAPFETEVVTLTGSTPAGVKLAVAAFLDRLLVNGVVAAAGWKRGAPNVLERDPISPTAAPPAWFLPQAGGATLIGITQAAEDEYRGVLADTGVEPAEIWRAKYYADGAWSGEGEALAFPHYAAGLHRRAYGNTLWAARFASAEEAAKEGPKIALAAGLKRAAEAGITPATVPGLTPATAAGLKSTGAIWTGRQPTYAGGTYPGDSQSTGPLTLWQWQSWVIMSTVAGAMPGGTVPVRSAQ